MNLSRDLRKYSCRDFEEIFEVSFGGLGGGFSGLFLRYIHGFIPGQRFGGTLEEITGRFRRFFFWRNLDALLREHLLKKTYSIKKTVSTIPGGIFGDISGEFLLKLEKFIKYFSKEFKGEFFKGFLVKLLSA